MYSPLPGSLRKHGKVLVFGAHLGVLLPTMEARAINFPSPLFHSRA